MKKFIPILAAIFVILIFLPKSFSGQNEDKVLTINADEISMLLYGSSNELINGKLYLPEHPRAKGNPFYDDRSKINGTIFIKGNKYPGQVFGYNIADEKIVLNVFQKNSSTQFEIELNEVMVDSMIINNTFFINSATNVVPGFEKGFVEIIYKGGFLFIKKHRKTFVNQYSSTSPYGFYTNDDAEYFLIYDTIPIKITSKKSLLKEFETHKKETKKYIKSVKFKFKKASSQQWVNLLDYCDTIASN
ncbi:MAG TPA: hypothetical protein VIN10_09485 [Bacteroidales bacterium]